MVKTFCKESNKCQIIIYEQRTGFAYRFVHATYDIRRTPSMGSRNSRIRAAFEGRYVHVTMFFTIRAPTRRNIVQGPEVG